MNRLATCARRSRHPIGPTALASYGRTHTSIPSRSKTAKEVPVASYAKHPKSGCNAAERTTLAVDGSQTSPKPVSGGDVSRRAMAFDGSVVRKMTPTMKRFTLEGKVAVVTG